MGWSTLECPHCGARLQIAPGQSYVKCEYCDSTLRQEKIQPEKAQPENRNSSAEMLWQEIADLHFQVSVYDQKIAEQKAKNEAQKGGCLQATLAFLAVLAMILAGVFFIMMFISASYIKVFFASVYLLLSLVVLFGKVSGTTELTKLTNQRNKIAQELEQKKQTYEAMRKNYMNSSAYQGGAKWQ